MKSILIEIKSKEKQNILHSVISGKKDIYCSDRLIVNKSLSKNRYNFTFVVLFPKKNDEGSIFSFNDVLKNINKGNSINCSVDTSNLKYRIAVMEWKVTKQAIPYGFIHVPMIFTFTIFSKIEFEDEFFLIKEIEKCLNIFSIEINEVYNNFQYQHTNNLINKPFYKFTILTLQNLYNNIILLNKKL